jgi:hypothetical protein
MNPLSGCGKILGGRRDADDDLQVRPEFDQKAEGAFDEGMAVDCATPTDFFGAQS